MKRTTLYLIVILTVLNGCDLDRQMVTILTKEQVNKQYEFTRNQNASLYSNLIDGFFSIGNAMEASASDEAAYTYSGGSTLINSGGWSAISNPDDILGTYYTAIRKVNDFLNPAVEVDLDAYRLDPTPSAQVIYENRKAEIERWRLEARFLRAFYFFEMVKRYGGLPIITKPLYLDSDFGSIERNSLSECLQFILDECNATSAPGALPAKYGNDDLGRVTKGAALALKSRVLLYMASDLYNSPDQWASGYPHPELISLGAGDRRARWKAAADAALEVINLTEASYNMTGNYAILGKTFNDAELIMVRRRGNNNDFERNNFPKGYWGGGNGGVTPSQNLVDAYEMRDGTPFDWNNPVHSSAPFANRDPRFGFSVYKNGDPFRDVVLECFVGGANHPGGIGDATRTGYYIKKFIDEALDLSLSRTSAHSWIYFRITEMYLNYAEALNEYDPGNPNILIYLNRVRSRTGVAMPAIPAADQNVLRQKIRNERRVELAFEGHRLWDTRRWMIATDVLNSPLYGIEITKQGDSYTYRKFEVEKRVFEPKMYFYPIPRSILLSTGNTWPQNPLW